MELKFNKKMIRTTKDLNKSVLYKLADLAERLKFKSEKISDLKAKNFNYMNGRLPFRQSKPIYIIDGLREY